MPFSYDESQARVATVSFALAGGKAFQCLCGRGWRDSQKVMRTNLADNARRQMNREFGFLATAAEV
jgi:hypothetical protein